jgi:hypothetical protein
MTVSFEITKAPIYRTFTIEESSAIHNIEIDGNFVEIIFQSNHEKAYLFEATNRYKVYLTEIIKSPDLLGFSLGSVIAKGRKVGDLKYIEEGGY